MSFDRLGPYLVSFSDWIWDLPLFLLKWVVVYFLCFILVWFPSALSAAIAAVGSGNQWGSCCY